MLKARKANRVLRIEDTKAEEYRALGYTITDMQGNVVLTPNDDRQRIKELEAENACLLSQIAAQKAAQTVQSGKGKGRK